MELHSRVNSTMAKRLRNVLKISFFMLRKGVTSKRKLMMDLNMMMKRGKLIRKTLSNLLFHPHHHHHSSKATARGGRFGIQEYEFSCSNSPNPVFFHLPKRNKHHYFPCINAPRVIEEEEEEEEAKAVVLMPKTPEHSFNFHYDANSDDSPIYNGEEEKLSPLLLSPFGVRISNYSSEEEDEVDEGGNNSNGRVDDEAEEFIRRFREQLRMQSRMQLVKY